MTEENQKMVLLSLTKDAIFIESFPMGGSRVEVGLEGWRMVQVQNVGDELF